MKIQFITGNTNKFREIAAFIPGVEQIDIDLPEIQEIDAEKIIASKLAEAQKVASGNFIVEDTSLALNCLNGLPGPLIKWFLKSLGARGIFELAEKYGDFGATVRTVIGLVIENGKTEFFSGEIRGQIVAPRGENGFGWDAIFVPNGAGKTFAEMSTDEKATFSMRKIACEKLAKFLTSSY